MNSWQLAQQIRHDLRSILWPNGDHVFGGAVFVYAGAAAADVHPPGFPFALVTVGAGTPDPDAPDLIEQTFEIVAATEVMGDPLGEAAMIGGNRTDYTSSAGAGALEIAERVRATVQALTGYDGAPVVVSGSGVGAPSVLDDRRHVVLSSFTVTALCTSQPYYRPPQRLRAANGSWHWNGARCSQRFDFQSFLLGYVSGSTPVATVTELDAIVTTTTNTFSAEAVLPGKVYQLFAAYNGHGAATWSDYSHAEKGTYVVT